MYSLHDKIVYSRPEIVFLDALKFKMLIDTVALILSQKQAAMQVF